MSAWISTSPQDSLKRVISAAYRASRFAGYRVRQELHRPFVPPATSPLGERIIHDMRFDGVSVTSLDELNLASTPAFRDAAAGAVEELNALAKRSRQNHDYPSGFEHCIPINPTRIAQAYPALYMWGLDEALLDIIERHIERPLAYHGVVIRREIVDERQVGTRYWHIDGEDYDITRISIYLSDVLTPDDGAFEYAPRSVSPPDWKPFGSGPVKDERMARVVPSWQWKSVCGPAETVLFKAVARVFHRGRIPQSPRIAASYYYTSRKPKSPQLCRDYSFQTGINELDVELTPRQLDCLWEYRDLYKRAQSN